MLTSRDRVEVENPIGNPLVCDYEVPIDHCVSPQSKHHWTAPMPEPRYLDEAGTNLTPGAANNGATQNTHSITERHNGSGWTEHSGPRSTANTQATPEPRWTGDRGTHPALRR